MTSPFASFRKHRTYWMAGTVLLAILAFVVAPAISTMSDAMRSGNHPSNDVVVRWSDGKVTSGTMAYVRTQHARTIRFLQALAREVVAAGGMPKVPGFRYDTTNKRVEDLGLPMLDSDRAVCQTMIIAARAKQLGIEFDRPVIEDFLVRFCDRKITSAQFDKIFRDNAGREFTKSELYRQLGLELSAVVMERIALAGVNYEGAPLVTPGTLWENYLKLNQSARIEAYPVLASDFIKQVKDAPSDAEIRQLYDAGAANFPSPNSSQPGFRRRYQANVEYVSGSWNKLLEVEKAKIGEEALRAEYDRLVGLGGLQVPVETPQPGKEAAPGDAKPNEEKPSDQKPDEAKSGEGKQAEQPTEGQPPAPKSEGDKAEGDKSEQDKSEQDKSEQDKSESKKDDEAKSDGDKPAEDAADKDQADPKSQSRAVGRDGQIRLVAFQQEGDDKKSDDEKSDENSADKKSEDKNSDDKQSDEKPADAQSSDAPPPVENPPSPENLNGAAATKPAADSAKSQAPAAKDGEAKAEEAKPDEAKTSEAKPSEAQPDAAQAPAGAAAPAAAGAGNTPMRTQTFEEARDSLARTLAMSVVRDQLQAKLQKIESAMNAYRTKKQMERLNTEAGRKSEGEPAKIDLKKLAEEEGLTYGSTGMIDGFRLASTPIGRSMIGNQALANTIMTPEVELFTPVRSMFIEMENPTEPDFQEFVSWKIDAVPAYTPELNDIRDEVIEAWKTQRARVMAEEEARKLADKLKSAGDEPWKSVLDAQKQTLVVNPPPFTWMSPPREMFAAAQISFVQGLDTVGQEFMQRVFATRPGQVAVAPNQGLNTYYVVRVLELTPTADQLRQNFEISRGRARQLAFPERERMFSDWYDSIERKLNVQWMATPETLMN